MARLNDPAMPAAASTAILRIFPPSDNNPLILHIRYGVPPYQ
jgi:hypothetical protein